MPGILKIDSMMTEPPMRLGIRAATIVIRE